jgi:hypothetical protein
MEHIQQHEWKHYTSSPLLTKIKCIHCKVKRITSRLDGEFVYLDEQGVKYQAEPACITRKLNEPQR